MVKTLTRSTIAALVLFGGAAMAQDVSLENHDDKQSYALGMVFGQQIVGSLEQAKTEINHDILLRALSDVITQQDTLMSQDELQAFLIAEQQKQIEAAQAAAAMSKDTGLAFLIEYAKKAGVMKTQSGIYYQVLTEGKGKKPAATDTVKVHYKGTLKDGKVFDSSIERGTPAEFPVNAVIQGWQEILPMMSTGAKWEIAIPADLAYGENGAGQDIGPNEPLVFEIELLEIK